jgi:integrase
MHADKPSKPYPDFPLFPHATKRWAKKIRGRTYYFGPWEDPDGALARYLEQKDDLHAGRTPRPSGEGLTVRNVVNAYLTHKQGLLEGGELSRHTWRKYETAAELVAEFFGRRRLLVDVRDTDFVALRKQMAARWGLYRLDNMVEIVRSMFNHVAEAKHLVAPIFLGPSFARPAKSLFRRYRAERGPKLFRAEEIRQLLEAANVPIRAMLFLGINCAYGNTDCGRLPRSAVDLAKGWIEFPRPKTGIARRCALWPETRAALEAAWQHRPAAKQAEDEDRVFLTRFGGSWAPDGRPSPLSFEIYKMLRQLGLGGQRGRGFYTLRHTFRTVADESKDQPAVDFIMGHEAPHMSSHYRQTISDERLLAVTEYVRTWLFGEAETA